MVGRKTEFNQQIKKPSEKVKPKKKRMVKTMERRKIVQSKAKCR